MPEGRANSSQISYLELVGLINQLLRASLFCALWPDGTWQHSGGSLFHMQNLRPHPRLPESDLHLQFLLPLHITTEESYKWAWDPALFTDHHLR